jgi:hypothetical protein
MLLNNLETLINEDVFLNTGGKCLGLKVLDVLADKFGFYCPKYRFVSLAELYSTDSEDVTPLLLESFSYGEKATYKYSTIFDDFSDISNRGINSSIGRKCVIGESDLHRKVFIQEIPKGAKGIIFQQFIENQKLYFIMHVYQCHLKVEIIMDDTRVVVCIDPQANIKSIFSNNQHHSDIVNNFISVIAAVNFFDIVQFIGFDFNVEGFYCLTGITLIQFRPIPSDNILDTAISTRILNVATKNRIHETKFVYNKFDFTIDFRNMQQSEEGVYINKSQYLITVINTSHTKVVSSGLIIRLFQQNKPVLLIDTKLAFCLSHSIDYIPANLQHRSRFFYFHLPEALFSRFINAKSQVLSDGDHCIIYQPKNER